MRRAHLGREAAVKLLGLIGYLGAALGLACTGFSVLGACGFGPTRNSGSYGYGLITVRMIWIVAAVLSAEGAAILAGIAHGLRHLHASARWTISVSAGSLLGLCGLYFVAVVLIAPDHTGVAALIYGSLGLVAAWPLSLMLGPRAAVVFSAEYRAVVCQTPHIRLPLGRIVGSVATLVAGVALLMGVMIALVWLNR